MNTNPEDEFWKAEVEKFLVPYPEELDMEVIQRKHFSYHGFWGTYTWP